MVEKMHIMYGHKLSHYKEKDYFSFSTLEEPSASSGRGTNTICSVGVGY